MVTGEAQVGWRDYVAVVTRRRWHFAIPCIAVVVIAMIWGMFQPKIYRAESLILIQDKSVMNPLIQGLAVSSPVGSRLRSLREQMLSWSSLSRLAKELGLDEHVRSPLAFERLIKKLQTGIVVRMRGTDLVAIAYEHEQPEKAQLLVNTITEIYMNRSRETHIAETETAITFIESEMDVYQEKLEGSERALRDFQELYVMQMPVATQLNDQVISLEVQLAQLLVENTELHPTVVQVKRQIRELKQGRNQEIKRVITTALARGQNPEFYQDLVEALEVPVDAAAKDPSIRAAQQAYTVWVDRLDHPSSAPLKAVPQVLPGGQIVVGVETPLGTLRAESTSISLAPRERQELVRLTRDYDVLSGTYHNMQSRLELAKVTRRLGESDEGLKFHILEPARLPLKPVRPNLIKIFFFSLMLGIFVGAGVAFIAEYLDQSFQSAEELQAVMELPVLGSISTIVTEGDIEMRRRRRQGWISLKRQLQNVKQHIMQPVWARFDRALVRWGL